MITVGTEVAVLGFGTGTVIDYVKDEMGLPYVVDVEGQQFPLRFPESSLEELPEKA